MIIFIAVLIFFIYLNLSMLKSVKRHQHGAIFRLGKFNRIAGPGLTVIIPDWEIRTNKQIEEKLKEHFESPENNKMFFKR